MSVKRYALTLLLVAALLLGFAVPAFALVFTQTILLVETDNNSYDMLPIVHTINMTYLAENGYCSNNGTDVKVTVGATEYPRMLATENVNWATPVVHNSSQIFTVTTNQTASDFDIVIGNGGYLTTADNATLEPSDNFSIELGGFDVRPVYDASDTIGVPVSENIVYGYDYTTRIEANNAVYNTAWTAATGTLTHAVTSYIGQHKPAGYYIYRGLLYFNTVNVTGTVTGANLHIWVTADASVTDFDITIQDGQPTYPSIPPVTTDFNRAYYHGDIGHLTTAGLVVGGYNTIPINTGNLTSINAGGWTKFILRSSREIAGTTPVGDEYITISTPNAAGTAQDPYLEIYVGDNVTPTLYKSQAIVIGYPADGVVGVYLNDRSNATLTGVTTQTDDIIASANTTHLTLQVGASTNTTALVGAGVSDTSDNWTLKNFAYTGNMTIAVDNVTQLWYQPNTLINGTVMPDRAGYDHPGVIHWGSNPSGITLTAGGLTYDAEAAAGAALVTPDALGSIEEVAPIHRTDTEIGGSPAHELYPLISDVATLADIPAFMLWMWLSAALALGGMALTRRFVNSVFATGLVGVVIMAAFAAMGSDAGYSAGVEWWMPASVLLATICTAAMQKTPSL